jgi:hypothetical protein
MQNIKDLFKNISILNMVLLTFVIIMITYTVFPFFSVKFQYIPPPGKKSLNKQDKSAAINIQIPSPSDYMLIAEENLFHPGRKIPPEKKAEAPPLPKPDLILYGTLITDDTGIAYLEDMKVPRNTPGRGRRQLIMRKGDILSGFTLKEIEVDKIVMVRGEEKMTVLMHESRKSKNRETPVATPVMQPAEASPAPAPTKPLPPSPNIPVRQPPRSSFESTVTDFFDNRNK